MAAETSSEAAVPPLPGGWHVTAVGLTKAAEAKTPDPSGKWLLDVDLREDGEASLPRQFDGLKAPGIFQPSLDCICPKPDQDDGLVLQVKSVRNVAAPKANEESGAAPRMLKMSLTDGHTTIHGLETSKLDGVSINSAPPGSKVRIQGKIPISSTGFLLLETGTVKCLGGKVAGLTDKWEQNRKLAHFTRAKSHGSGGGSGGTAVSGTEGPPPWVPFGKKIKSNIDHSDQQQQGSNAKKSEQPKQQQQQIGAGDDETNGDDEGECEFDSQRQDAIKELSTTTKKVFGGGTKEIKDGGRKGRSNTAQAVSSSSLPNDDSSLKGKDNSETSAKGRKGGGGGSDPIEASSSDTLRGERRGKKGRKGAKGEADGAADGSKPADKVHLFDFLGEKFPDAEEPTKESIASAAANSSSLQNNGRKFGDNSNTSSRNRGNSTNEGGKGRDTNRRGENRNSDSRRGGGDRQQQHQPQQQRRDGEREKPPRHQQQQDRSDKRQNGSSIKKWDLSERPPRSDRPERSDNRNDRDHQTSSRGRGYRDHHPEGSNHNGGRQDRRNGGGDRGGSSAGAGGRGGRRGGGQQHGGSGGGQAQSDRDFGEWCNSTYHNATAQQQQRNSGGQRPNHYSQQSTTSAISQQRQQHQQELLASMKNMNLADMGKQQQHHHHENTNGYQQHPNSSGGYGTNYPANNQPGRGKSRQQQQWQVGDECLAKYWEDEKYYPVRVTAISKNNTAVVYFLDYGNHEEVFLNDIRPSTGGGGGGGAGSKSTSSGGGFIPTTPGLPPAFPQTY